MVHRRGDAAWKAEPRTTQGGQPRYSGLAIATALTLRAVFRLALGQTGWLIGSIIALLGLNLAVPDHAIPEPPGGNVAAAPAKSAPWQQAHAPVGGQHGH